MLEIGKKYELVKELKGYNLVGNIFELVDIQEGAVSVRSNLGIGVISKDEFDTYFKEYEDTVILSREEYNRLKDIEWRYSELEY